MTNNNDNTQPRPWSIREERNSVGEPFWTMWDADGMFLKQFGSHENSRLIVEAVNEHDRLRDLVRRLADALDLAADALWQANIAGRLAITHSEPRRRHLHGVDIDALINAARAAIGEEASNE